jgi:hypothetical protein
LTARTALDCYATHGSAAPHTVAALAQRHAGSTSVPTDPELLADYFTFTD